MLDIEVFLVFFFALTMFTAQIAVNLYFFFAVRTFYFVHYFVMNFKNNVLFKLQFSVFNLVFYSTVAVRSNTFTVFIEH